METYSWIDKDEEGNKITYQATHFGGWWQLESEPKLGRAQRDEVDFSPAEFNSEIWTTLRELLWRKYLRRRVAYDVIENIDNILAGKSVNERRDRRNPKGDDSERREKRQRRNKKRPDKSA